MTPRRLRPGANPVVDVGWALYELALLVGELACEAGIAACQWWLNRHRL